MAGVRKVLIKDTDLPAKAVAKMIGNARGAENVESEILPLPPELLGLAIDPPKANATGKIGDKSATVADKVVAQSQVHPEVVVLDPANDRLS